MAKDINMGCLWWKEGNRKYSYLSTKLSIYL